MRMTPLGVYAGWARLHPSSCSLNPIPLYWCCRENTRVLPDLHQDRESSLFFSTSCPSQILSWPWMLLYPGGNRAMVPPSFALICRFWWEEGVCSSPLRRTDMNLLSGEEMSRSPSKRGTIPSVSYRNRISFCLIPSFHIEGLHFATCIGQYLLRRTEAWGLTF